MFYLSKKKFLDAIASHLLNWGMRHRRMKLECTFNDTHRNIAKHSAIIAIIASSRLGLVIHPNHLRLNNLSE